MACPQPPYNPFGLVVTINPNYPSTLNVSGPALFLSNNPEQVPTPGADGYTNLWKTAYSVFLTPTRIRSYGWHVNATQSPLNIGLVAGSPNLVSLVNFRSELVLSPGGGQCLAKAQLYNSYEPLGTVTLGAADVILPNCAGTIQPGGTIGFVAEFDATPTTSGTLNLRTVAWTGDATDAPGDFTGPLPPLSGTHPRGSWPHADSLLSGGSFDVAPGAGPETRQISCCAKDGAEEDSFPGPPAPPPPFPPPIATANRGLFGVNLVYRFQVSNSGDGTHNLWVYLAAQKTGKTYFGAGKILAPGDNDDKGVPPLLHGGINFVELTTLAAHVIPPTGGGDPVIVDVTVANGASATMPFLLILSRVDLRAHP